MDPVGFNILLLYLWMTDNNVFSSPFQNHAPSLESTTFPTEVCAAGDFCIFCQPFPTMHWWFQWPERKRKIQIFNIENGQRNQNQLKTPCMYRYSIFSVLTKYLLPILFIFNRIHSTTWLGSQSEVKLGIFTETTGITQERIFLIIVNSSAKCPQKVTHQYHHRQWWDNCIIQII